jgi:hypothetical protein
MTAVALSTLRNDIEGVESPLDIYEAGSPWPEVDPGKDEHVLELRGAFYDASLFRIFQMFIGVGRSAAERTRYNAS